MYLYDTNVVSELRKGARGDARVAAWSCSVNQASVYLSAITFQEIEIGTLQIERRDILQGRMLRAWVDHIRSNYRGRILPVDEAVASRSAQFHVPDPRPYRDSLIAATALVHGLIVVTRNVADFAPMKVPLFNPWEDEVTASQPQT